MSVAAAKPCQNHLALRVMQRGRYLSGPLSVSRFSRCLHTPRDRPGLALATLGALFAEGETFRIASMPAPVWRRARRRREVRGRARCGHSPLAGATVSGDKGYSARADEATLLAETGVRLVSIRKATMRPNNRAHRRRIEALHSQLEAMGVQQLRARTIPGLELKPHALLLAAAIINAD